MDINELKFDLSADKDTVLKQIAKMPACIRKQFDEAMTELISRARIARTFNRTCILQDILKDDECKPSEQETVPDGVTLQ